MYVLVFSLQGDGLRVPQGIPFGIALAAFSPVPSFSCCSNVQFVGFCVKWSPAGASV
jgi:hypothetical protein